MNTFIKISLMLLSSILVLFSIGMGQTILNVPTTPYPTITAAIAAANPGDIINIAAGSQTENSIHINKSVTIQGAGISSTTIEASNLVCFYIETNNITIRDLKIHNAWRPIYGDHDIANITVSNVNFDAYTQRGIELQHSTGGFMTNILVNGCTFTPNGDITSIRMSSSRKINGFEIANSIFNGGDLGFYEANDGGAGIVTNLHIHGCTFNNYSFAAVYAEEIQNSVVENNVFNGNARGFYIYKAYNVASVTNVVVQHNDFNATTLRALALVFYVNPIAGFSFTENTITGGNYFMYFDADPAISGFESIHINRNSITGITVNHFYNPDFVPGGTWVLDLSNNYWGTTNPALITSDVTPISMFDFTPMINSGVDGNGATAGFIPDLSQVTVHAAAGQSGATGRIQEGINLVSSSTVNVAAGTYNEFLNVNKSVTLLGSNADIDPNTGTRGTETIINGGSGTAIIPSFSSIVIKGFTITTTDAGFPIYTGGTDVTGLTISNNIVSTGVRAITVATNGGNISLLNNLITGKGYGINFGNGIYPNLKINSNVVNGPDDYYAVFINGNGVINNFEFKNNKVYECSNIAANISNGTVSGNTFNAPSASGLDLQICLHNSTVSGNTFGGTGACAGLQLYGSQYGLVPSNTVTISGNSFTNCTSTAYVPTPFGIQLSQDIQHITITNNMFSNCYDAVNTRTGTGWDVTGDDIHINHNTFANVTKGVRNTVSGTLDATNNWWGTAVESAIQAKIIGSVTYDPWTGKAVSEVITSASTGQSIPVANTNVTLDFTSLPAGTNATVSVQVVPSVPTGLPPLPANVGTIAPLYLIFTPTGLTNGTFSCTVTIDVSGISGFSASTVLMYYSTITNSWVGVPGTYDGVAHTFTFTTDHFTPFVFVNPSNPDNLSLTVDNTNPAENIFYPQFGMGTGTTYGVGDWTYATPKCTMYVVPTGPQGIVAAKFRILYDASKASLSVTPGNLFNGNAFYTVSPGSGQMVIQSSNLDQSINIVPGSNKYLAMLVFTILKPGFNSIDLDGIDFRYYDAGSDAQNSVYVTTTPGAIKFYLGDFAKAPPSPSTSIGDGRVEFSDLSPFSSSYWSTNNVLDPLYSYYRAKYDIGPTSTNGYFAMPVSDHVIEFEDLVIFSIGYGKSAAGQLPKQSVQPITLAALAPLPQSDGTIRVPITVSGAVTDIRALSLSMSYPSTMTFVGVTKAGEFDNDYSFMKSKAEGGKLTVDAAILGLEHKGVSGAGVIAYAVFNGKGNVRIEQVRARNSANNPIGMRIENIGTVPTVYSLSQNYPNPFNPTTTIQYALPKDAQVKIVIYNMLGEEVTTLVNGMQSAGSYSATWNGKDGIGQTVSSGMYIYKMTAGDYVGIKKMVFMK